jgi:hypothetical protein
VDCWLLWGKVGLAHGEQTTVPLDVPAAYRFDPTWVNAAIWWPRGSGGPARDVDLFLLDRSGQPAPAPSASSTSLETVFEWVGSQGRMAAGEAKLRIKATQVAGGGAQTVYWVAALGMR